MYLFDLLTLMDVNITPEKSKIHLATKNVEGENPLDEYDVGDFPEWQSWQSKLNFERPFVVALISLPEVNKWLFAGAYTASGAKWDKNEESYKYKMSELMSCNEMNGRLVVEFKRPGRQSYLVAENWINQITVSEVRPTRRQIKDFPGYREINISKKQLDSIIGQGIESWRVALSNVAGVYLISDTMTGKLYVGSASGEGGIWQRWRDYARTGHGGNKELINILKKDKDPDRSLYFHYSILEIADLHEKKEGIIHREEHWKTVLRSLEYGYNK